MFRRQRRWVLAVALLSLPLLAVLHADLTPAAIYLEAGDLLARNWDHVDALAMYERAEQVAAGQDRVRAGIGVTLSAIRLAQFEFAYVKAAELRNDHQDDLDVRTTYGQAAWSAGLFDAAEASFRDVIASRPADTRALVGMARVLVARNRLDEALSNALAAATSNPKDADAYYLVGHVCRRLGRLDEATDWYGKYLSMVPRNETDRRAWVQGEIALLKSFGRHVPGQMDVRSQSVIHTIPFRMVRDKIMVQGRVNGDEWAEFIVDTGAEQTVISQATAKRLGVVPISATISAGVGEVGLRGLQNAALDSLQIGSLVVRNVPCLIKTPALAGLPSRESESFSPLALGLSVVIDYRRKEILLGTQLPEQPADVKMPLWFSRLATVRGLVNDERPSSFIVDTGGEVVSISRETAAQLTRLSPGRRIPVPVFGTSGWDREAYILPGLTLSFDSVLLRNFSVVVLNLHAPSMLLGYRVGGTLGHVFLSRYRVTIDLQRGVLALGN